MNTIDALRIINAQVSGHNGNTDLWMALDEIEDLIAAYDSLAPDWSQAPEWAQWYVIDASGWRWFCMFEPEINSTEWFLGRYGSYVSSGEMPIPLGVDWRLLKWQRPEVA